MFITVRQYDIKSVNIQVNESVTVWLPGSLFHQAGKIPHSTPIALHTNCNRPHCCYIPTNCLTIGNLYSFFARQFIPRYIGIWQKKNKKIHDEQKRKNRPVPSIRWYRNGIISPEFIEGIFRAAQNSGTLVFSGASLCFGQTETACSHYWT